MDMKCLFEWIEKRQHAIKIWMVPILAMLVASVYLLVYVTGGIKFVYSHSMYLPILIAGFVFGIKGGIITALVGGLALGPFMPIEVATGEQQLAINWLYRSGFFLLFGILSGLAADSATSYIKHLRWLSLHDCSTKLPNRKALLDRLEPNALLIVISLENVMELKSTLGFSVIDEAVRQLASRFSKMDMGKELFRIETRQLAILLFPGDMEDKDAALRTLISASREPILYNGISIHVDSRMGITEIGENVCEPPERYLQEAEAALTIAEEKLQDSVPYSPEIMAATTENLVTLGELKKAIEHCELSLHYQPKVRIADGMVCGAEALMRWTHPTRGNIPPGMFIPRAEQSTLIQMITEFALKQTMEQIVVWERCGIQIPIAVNISTRNLLQPDFSDFIAKLIDQYGIRAELLELEVTEGSLMVDMEQTVAEMMKLAGLKIIMSVDDFGTGYSSLQYLHKLPISFIKIDQSFVMRSPADKGAAVILEVAVDLAHKMGIKAIAEGVEDEKVYAFLHSIGCDMAQGYAITHPLAPDAFRSWYERCNGVYMCSES